MISTPTHPYPHTPTLVTHTCTHLPTSIHTHTCTHTYTHAPTHSCTHPHIHTHTHIHAPTCFISLHHVWAQASAAATSSAFEVAATMSAAEQSAASWELEQGDSLTVSPMLARALASTDMKLVSRMRKACLATWAPGPVSSPSLSHRLRAGTNTWSKSSSIPPRRPSSLQSKRPKYSS